MNNILNRDNLMALGCLLLIIVVFTGLLAMLILAGDQFRERCELAGNHVVEDHDLNVGLDTNLDLVFTSETDRFCLTPEGAIVEID